MHHSNKIMYTIGLGEVRMNLASCLAGLQVVKKDRAMGPIVQYKPGLATVLASHQMRARNFLYLFLLREC